MRRCALLALVLVIAPFGSFAQDTSDRGPKIRTDRLPDGKVGVVYSAAINVNGGQRPYIFSVSSGSLPPGLSLGVLDGEIRGTPTTEGRFDFTIRVVDARGDSDRQQYRVRVEASDPPQITTASLPGGTVGSSYSATLEASGGSPPYSWSANSLPPGLSINSGNGQITGTPSTAGSFNASIQVTDSAAGTTSKVFAISIASSLSITTASLPNGTVGSPYAAALTASGGVRPLAWSISAGSLPPGLTLNPESGELSGTPSSAGTSSFTVRVTDSGGGAATKQFSIQVTSVVSITTASLPGGSVGQPYAAALAASGGTPPYDWSISAGSLPGGLSLNAGTGQIGGTPTTAGEFNFTVQVRDSTGGTATRSYGIAIVPGLSITTASLPNGTVGSVYSAALAASGGTPPLTWSVSGGALPAGLALDAASGAIGGTPSSAGAFEFTVQVADSAGATASRPLGITIADRAPDPLEILGGPLPGATFGVPYSQPLTGRGGRPPYAWSLASGSLPPGLGLDASSGVIAGTPSAAGTYTFTVRLTDSATTSTTRDLSITVTSTLAIATSEQLPGGGIGARYHFTLVASGGAPPYRWSITFGALPDGLSLEGQTGVLAGTPTTSGNFAFTLEVRDSANATAAKAFILAVAEQLSITNTSPLPAAAVGSAYSQAFAALAGTPPYRWGISAGSLPAGLALNTSTGVLTGTPTTAGTFDFTVQVSDGASAFATKQFTITVVAALSVTTVSLPGAAVAAPYSQTLTAIAGTSPYFWSIVAGSLPPGLSLNAASGLIGGTPTSAGAYQFTAQVRDAVGATATQQLSIAVSPTLAITTASPLPGAMAGRGYTQALAASGGTPPYTWSVGSGALPAGLALDGATGAIGGTPQAAGDFQFTVQITDGLQATIARAYTLKVGLEPLPAIEINSLPATAPPLEQPRAGLTLARAYPVPITGNLVLSFEPDAEAPGDDPAIQFAGGGRTLEFTVPADATEAVFASTPALQTGSVSGTITVEARLHAGGVDATPSPAPVWQIKVNRSAPIVRNVRLVRTSAGFEVWVTGLSPPKEITQATVRFTPADGAGLQTTQVTLPMADAARQWFQDSTSRLFGSQFTLVLPFTVQGNANAVASVSVTLNNTQGASEPVSASF